VHQRRRLCEPPLNSPRRHAGGGVVGSHGVRVCTPQRLRVCDSPCLWLPEIDGAARPRVGPLVSITFPRLRALFRPLPAASSSFSTSTARTCANDVRICRMLCRATHLPCFLNTLRACACEARAHCRASPGGRLVLVGAAASNMLCCKQSPFSCWCPWDFEGGVGHR
jgi:hypothetical protein